MTPAQRRGVTLIASLTLATTALSGTVAAQSPAASAGASMAAAGAPDLFGTTYLDRVTDGTSGGSVIIADWQEAANLQPYYQGGVTEADVTAATFAGLATQTDDFKYMPDLAVSIPTTENGGVVVNDDGSATVTWKLRDGLQWSDGQPLTCADYKFTAGWFEDPTNVGIYQGKAGFLTDAGLAKAAAGETYGPEDVNLSVDCKSDTDMVWTFKEPYEGYILLMNIALPEHYLKDIPIADQVAGNKGFTAAEMPNVPTSGPYKFESVTPGQELRLARNDNYKSARTGKPAYLDSVVFKWYSDPSAMIAAYSGSEPEYDLGKDLNNAHIPAVQGLNNVKILDSLTYEFLRPNWDAKHCSLILQPARNGECPMSDPNVRRALSLAIDRQAIKDRLLTPNSALAYTNVSPNSWFYAPPAETPAVDLDAAAALLDTDYPVNPDSGFRFHNLNGLDTYICSDDPNASPHTSADTGTCDESKRLPIKDANESDLRIEACTTTSQTRQDLLAMLSGQLNQIGVQVVISPVSSTDIFGTYNVTNDQTPCNLSHGNFDLALHAFSVSLDPVANYLYHSSQFEPNGQNDAHVSSPDLDKLLDTLKGTVDIQEVMQLAADFQKYYVDNTIEVPVYFRNEVYLQSPKLENFTGNPTTSGPLWNIQDWYWAN